MLDTLAKDFRYALRALAKSPAFTAVAVLTLALGIGANTAVFTLLDAALFRRLDVPEPSRLVWLTGTSAQGSRFRGLSYPEYLEHRDADSVFTGLMAYDHVPVALSGGGEPERVQGLIVTGGYFRVLGVRLQAGRAFSPEEDATPLTHPVVVLGDALWRGRFGADPGIVGTSIVLDGQPYTVIGVAPRGFTGVDLGEPGDLFVPMAMMDRLRPDNGGLLANRGARWLRVVGRLRPGVTMDAARAQVGITGARIAAQWPESMERTGAGIEPMVGGLDPDNRRDGIPIFTLLMAVPAMVLLIACANAANLLLARATGRRREIAVRLALGATRARLVRMLLAESLLLALAAGALGTLLALWLSDIVGALGEVPSYITGALAPDLRVLAFTMTLALGTGLVFGLVPALGATRLAVAPALKDEGPGQGRLSRSRLVRGFVMTQVAASLVLLVVAGLFLRTLDKATRADLGFDARHGIAMTYDLTLQGYDAERQGAFDRLLLERVRALPGVEAASLVGDLPFSEREVSGQVLREGDQEIAGTGARDTYEGFEASFTVAWPDYFRTLGKAPVMGRDFAPSDDARAPRVVIVNRTLARRLWPGQSPLGKRLRLAGRDEPLREVVGVVPDTKVHALTEGPRGFLFFPERQQQNFGGDLTLVVRTTGEGATMLPPVRAILRGMDANLPVYRQRSLEDQVRLGLDKERAASALLGSFGALALVLAALGLYGVMAYAVTQRTREMGIRMALGAARRDVLRLIVVEGVRLASVGIVVGLVLSAALTRVIGRFLYGVTPTDAVTFAAVAMLLAGVAALASLVPARRAVRVDPMVALRAE